MLWCVLVQGVMLMVDLCGRGWDDQPRGDAHCVKRAAWSPPPGGESWAMSVPLQVGGLAHSLPRPQDHGWVEAPTMPPLHGCISHLTLNGQVRYLPLTLQQQYLYVTILYCVWLVIYGQEVLVLHYRCVFLETLV